MGSTNDGARTSANSSDKEHEAALARVQTALGLEKRRSSRVSSAGSVITLVGAISAVGFSLDLSTLVGAFGSILWIALAIVVAVVFAIGINELIRRRSRAWSKAVERTVNDPKEIRDPVIRNIVGEITEASNGVLRGGSPAIDTGSGTSYGHQA